MPTQKPRFSIAIDDDLLQQVDDYKFSNRVKSQNQAINDLLRAGIEELKIQRRRGVVEKEKQLAEGGELSQVEVEFFNEFRKIPDSHKGLAASLCTALVRELVKHQTIEIKAEAAVPVVSNR